MFSPPPKHIGLLRVIDACQIIDNPTSHSDPQRTVEFTQANFSQVTGRDVLNNALAALHPDKPFAAASNTDGATSSSSSSAALGEWVVCPQLVASSRGDEDGAQSSSSSSFQQPAGGFALPFQASLLAAGIVPSSGASSEVYLTGRWRWFVPSGYQRDVVVATVDAASGGRGGNNNNNDSYASYYSGDDGSVDSSFLTKNNNNNRNNSILHSTTSDATVVGMGFVPSVVQVTLWSVPDKPVYEVDVRRPLSTLTCGKLKKIVSKFAGIAIDEMDVDVDNHTVRDPTEKLFPFIFDPSAMPQVRIRSRNDFVDAERTTSPTRAQQMRFLTSQNSSAAAASAVAANSSFSSSPRSRARVEAEYGASFPLTSYGAGKNNLQHQQQQQHMSPQPGGHQNPLQQVDPAQSRDWNAWLEQRRGARDVHVRSVLVPSSKEQIEVERALQVKTMEDVKHVTRVASLDLASSAQLLHQKLECVREEILREKLGDQGFAKIEGSRAMNGLGPVKTSVNTDGVNREPLVVSFR